MWQKHKKRIVITAVVVVMLAAGIWLFRARPVIERPFIVAHDGVRSVSGDYTGYVWVGQVLRRVLIDDSTMPDREILTEQIDPEALVELLANTMSRRMFLPKPTVWMGQIDWDISLLLGSNEHMHIRLGDTRPRSNSYSAIGSV